MAMCHSVWSSVKRRSGSVGSAWKILMTKNFSKNLAACSDCTETGQDDLHPLVVTEKTAPVERSKAGCSFNGYGNNVQWEIIELINEC